MGVLGGEKTTIEKIFILTVINNNEMNLEILVCKKFHVEQSTLNCHDGGQGYNFLVLLQC